MRRLFFLVTGPLLFDACVALWLGISGPKPVPPPQSKPMRADIVFFDKRDAALGARGHARDIQRRLEPVLQWTS